MQQKRSLWRTIFTLALSLMLTVSYMPLSAMAAVGTLAGDKDPGEFTLTADPSEVKYDANAENYTVTYTAKYELPTDVASWLDKGYTIEKGTSKTLTKDVKIPKGTTIPAGITIPAGTVIPQGTTFVTGTVMPFDITIKASAYGYETSVKIPKGTTLDDQKATQINTYLASNSITLADSVTLGEDYTTTFPITIPSGTTITAGSDITVTGDQAFDSVTGSAMIVTTLDSRLTPDMENYEYSFKDGGLLKIDGNPVYDSENSKVTVKLTAETTENIKAKLKDSSEGAVPSVYTVTAKATFPKDQFENGQTLNVKVECTDLDVSIQWSDYVTILKKAGLIEEKSKTADSYIALSENGESTSTTIALKDLTDHKVKTSESVDVKMVDEDQAAADAVTTQINALPSAITLDNKDAVDAAQKAYDALSDRAKTLVSDETKTKLDNAQAAIKKLEDEKATAEDQAAADAAADKKAQDKGKSNGVPSSMKTESAATKTITNAKSDDLSGSPYRLLSLKTTSQKKTSFKIKWNKVSGAKKYVVYANKCGKNNKYKKLTTTTKNTLNLTKVAGKKVKKGTYYKVYVIALDSRGNVLSTSKTIHVATKGGKVTNAKKITIKNKKKATKALKKLKKGKSYTIKTKQTKVSKKLKLKKHRAVKYESSNSKIAKVNSKGKITGVKKGSCYIYAYAQDGVATKIKVTVK